jgi:ABC-2 type transport system ATP-binding protein
MTDSNPFEEDSPMTAEQAPPANSPVMIEADRLCKYYGDFTAIENVSFQIHKGSVTAFLGPNGAGKSTTMRILTGYLAPSSGVARIAGFDVDTDRLSASRKLGYLPENGPLYLDMTPAALLRYAASMRGMSGGDMQAALDRVTRDCHIAEVWHKPIRKLSRWYRQRVGLAQALLHDPEVLIMDEPTAGLDPKQIVLVRELIERLRKTKTILLSTHILQEVEAMADRIIVVNDGRKIYDGTPASFGHASEFEHRFLALVKGEKGEVA